MPFFLGARWQKILYFFFSLLVENRKDDVRYVWLPTLFVIFQILLFLERELRKKTQ